MWWSKDPKNNLLNTSCAIYWLWYGVYLQNYKFINLHTNKFDNKLIDSACKKTLKIQNPKAPWSPTLILCRYQKLIGARTQISKLKGFKELIKPMLTEPLLHIPTSFISFVKRLNGGFGKRNSFCVLLTRYLTPPLLGGCS